MAACCIEPKKSAQASEAEQLGIDVAEDLLSQGADQGVTRIICLKWLLNILVTRPENAG